MDLNQFLSLFAVVIVGQDPYHQVSTDAAIISYHTTFPSDQSAIGSTNSQIKAMVYHSQYPAAS